LKGRSRRHHGYGKGQRQAKGEQNGEYGTTKREAAKQFVIHHEANLQGLAGRKTV
jgi:hypothetical protein